MSLPKPPGSDDYKGEPPWDEYYEKYDSKLVDLFRLNYDNIKLGYFRIKCSKSMDDAIAIYQEYMADSFHIGNWISRYYNPALPDELILVMSLELENALTPITRKYCVHYITEEWYRMPERDRANYKQEMEIRWIADVKSSVCVEDYRELELLETAYKKKYYADEKRLRLLRQDKNAGEPPWGEYYKKYDHKLVDMFKESYDETKLAYYRIKCSKSLEEGLAIYEKSAQSSIMERIMEYAPTSESMPRELMSGVVHREMKYIYHIEIRQIRKVPREQRKEYQRQKKTEWIIQLRSDVSEEDRSELEKLERAQKEKKK